MPRGDKKHVLDYMISVPSIDEQQKIIAEIEALEAQIAEAQKITDSSVEQKQKILEKYLK